MTTLCIHEVLGKGCVSQVHEVRAGDLHVTRTLFSREILLAWGGGGGGGRGSDGSLSQRPLPSRKK